MITKIEKSTIYYVDTNRAEYIRYGEDSWYARVGMSFEEVVYCEKIEEEFQEFMKQQQYAKCGCGGNMVPTDCGMSCDICG